jgi:hypothetical protein
MLSPGLELRFNPNRGDTVRELNIDLWDRHPDARVITTNPAVNRRGELVMGRGCAREAALRFEGLARHLGSMDAPRRRCCQALFGLEHPHSTAIVTFVVKHHWRDEADPDLILKSAHQLVSLADRHGWRHVLMPRPGCGNGRLRWPTVRELLVPVLDDRFFVTHVPAKAR